MATPPRVPRGAASTTASTTSQARKATSGKSAAPPASAEGAAPPRVLLLTGAESGRKRAEAQRLLREAVDADFADFDAETLDGATATPDRVLSAVATVPLGEGRRVVLVWDTQQMEAEDQKRIAAALPRIPASGLLILHTGTPIVEDGKTRRQSIVATELTNAVKKAGQIVEFSLPRAEDVRGWAQQEARALGKTLAPDAVALLAQLPNEDLQRLRTEIAKAASHAGDAPTITSADVEATLSRGPDDVIFKLCDAVGARRKPEALGHVSTLFRAGGRPDAIAPRALVLLARQIRLLAQFHYLNEPRGGTRSGPPPDPQTVLPSDGAGSMIANPRMRWMSDKYAAQARNFSGLELSDRLEKLLQADLALKGIVPGGDSPQALMQKLVIELC